MAGELAGGIRAHNVGGKKKKKKNKPKEIPPTSSNVGQVNHAKIENSFEIRFVILHSEV